MWSALKLGRAISDRALSVPEAVAWHLDRIARFNPAVNAVVTLVAERARDEARHLQAELCAGRSRGPLHGVPVTIKDSHDTAGIRTTAGTLGWRARVPKRDSTPVARLRAAGCVVLGKTNTPEFTLSFETDNLVFGRTHNPYDLQRSPGGSSGGAAASLATGMASLELGSDLGGSIRVPASFCGVVGFKPSAGRVPRTGHAFPGGGLLDTFGTIGPLARTVADVVAAYRVIAGSDGQDPGIVAAALGALDDVSLPTLRALFWPHDGLQRPAPDVACAALEAATALAGRGLNVEHGVPPFLADAFFTAAISTEADGGALIGRLLSDAGTRTASAGLATFLDGPSPAGLDGWRALLRGQSGLSAFLGGFAATADGTLLEPAMQAALRTEIARLRAECGRFFGRFDVLISPAAGWAAPPPDGATSRLYTTAAWNLLGLPVCVVPVGQTSAGLPVGIQVAAAPGRDATALAVARGLESALGGFRPPALVAR